MRSLVPPAPPVDAGIAPARAGQSSSVPAFARLHPPAPPFESARAPVAREGGRRGRADSFSRFWTQGGAGKLVDHCNCHYAKRGSTKRCGRFARFQLPRVGPFLPRVGLFFPCVAFPASASSLSLFLEISEEREKEERGKKAKSAIHESVFEVRFVSTSLTPHPRITRGCRIAKTSMVVRTWTRRRVDPRIHVCFPCGTPGGPVDDQ